MITGEIALAYPLCKPDEKHHAPAWCFFLYERGAEMINLQSKINKLVAALRMNGVMVKINTQQYFSEKQGRVCTKMILWEEHPNRDGETYYSKVDLLKALVEKWKEVKPDAEKENGTENR